MRTRIGLSILLLSFIFYSFSAYCQIADYMPDVNAGNVPVDMQFKLTFNTVPVLQSSGTIKLFQSNGTLVATIDMSQMPSGTPMSADWPWIERLNSTDIRVFRAVVDGKTAIFSFPIGSMNYSQGYYVTVDRNVFSNAGSLGFNGIAANQWEFSTKQAPATDLNYTVAADGSGDFATLQGALNYLPSNNTNAANIYIKNGNYVALAFCKSKNNITIRGESRKGVVIKAFNNSNLNGSTHWRSVVNLQGDNLNIVSLTIINTTPNGGTQAESIKLNGNYCVIANCEFYSYQDTQLLEGKVYLKDCLIEGDVDFIWGTGTVYFQSCELRANDNGGYNVMARNNNTKHGYCFADCNLSRVSGATATQYLGRDANTSYPYAEIVYLECTLGSQIPAVGWNIRAEMNGTGIHFAEYKSVDINGNRVNTSGRHYLSKQLSDSDASLYRDLNWYFNGWVPEVPEYTSLQPITCIYEYAGNDDSWNNTTNWTPRIPLEQDTAIIRTGEVKVYENVSCYVKVEPNGILRSLGDFSIPNVELIGGTMKVHTTSTGYGFDANVNVQESSVLWAGSAETSEFSLQGTISGSADLTKTNTGILNVNADATEFSGNWYINEGTLRTTNASAVGENTVTVSSGAKLDIATDNVSVFKVVLANGTLILNRNLTVKKCSISGIILAPGTYMAADYPSNISGTAILTVTGNPDCAGVEDGTAYIDNCNECVGGTTGVEACEKIVVEAEDVTCSFSGSIDSDNLGFSGTGFVNTDNVLGTTVTFNMYAEKATTIIFGVQYANGSTDRPAQILVNGEEAVASFSMPTTSWTDYQSVETTFFLKEGVNEISMVALTGGGFGSLDYYYAYGASFAGCETTQSLQLIAGWNLVSLYVIPSENLISSVFPHATEVKTLQAFYNELESSTLNTLTKIKPGVGYLVKNSVSETITINGSQNLSELSVLQNGLNLIGSPYSTSTSFSDAFGAELNDIQKIQSFDGVWIPGGTQTIQTLEPGKAYFVWR